MESRFDHDFGHVRVFSDEEASRRAKSIHADAFTTRADIVFDTGKYAPETHAGRLLIAHELAHVVQQDSRPVPNQAHSQPPMISQSTDFDELSARAAASFVATPSVAATSNHLMNHFGLSSSLNSPAMSSSAPVIQRHDSFEHYLMGNATVEDLEAMAGGAGTQQRLKVLQQELERMQIWADNPEGVTEEMVNTYWPNAQTLRLKKSGLLVSYGDLNALPDYVANPAAIDDYDTETMLKILQMIRQQVFNRLADKLNEVSDQQDVMDYHGVGPSQPKATNSEPLNQSSHFQGDHRPIEYNGTNTPGTPVPAVGSGPNHKLEHKSFKNAAGPEDQTTPWGPALETTALDWDTSGKGINHYEGLLARNACHFAPYSWYRWEEFHKVALKFAKNAATESNPETKKEQSRQALLNSGYADHFLEDSFAAGHLIDKTLVMQWFVEWIGQSLLSNIWAYINIPNWSQIRTMTTSNQPDIAGQKLYDQNASSKTRSNDPHNTDGDESFVEDGGVSTPRTLEPDALRTDGDESFAEDGGVSTPITLERDALRVKTPVPKPVAPAVGYESNDPQTAQEKKTKQERMEASGVRANGDDDQESAYQNYLAFLDSTMVQSSAAAVHDYFNKQSLWVSSPSHRGPYQVWGDDTFFTGGTGVEIASETAKMSRESIFSILLGSEPKNTTENIRNRFPDRVSMTPGVAPSSGEMELLEYWNTKDSSLHELCTTTIFPNALSSIVKNYVLSHIRTSLGSISPDTEKVDH